jgi:nucleoside-diphosphate-sugar epimerase
MREWRALDCSKAQQQLGFAPRPFLETVRDTLAWFKEYQYL